jgi:hypothetical protein
VPGIVGCVVDNEITGAAALTAAVNIAETAIANIFFIGNYI